MNNNWGIFLGVVAAGLFAIVLTAMNRNNPQAELARDQARAEVSTVRVYPVPVDRGEEIREAIRTVLMVGLEGSTPLGQASLPIPGQLLVMAPASMQPSIGEAIKTLAGGESVAPSPAPAAVRIDFWVVETAPDLSEDAPELAATRAALDALRNDLGDLHFRLADRLQLGAALDGQQTYAETERTKLEFRLRQGPQGVTGEINFRLGAAGGGGTNGPNATEHRSTLPLTPDQWTVLALLSGKRSDGPDAPERAVLMRVTPMIDARS